jgi:hypothetical protein
MEAALQQKKQKILTRLENTIESVNTILYEINQELETILEQSHILESTADIYDIWVSKD